MSATKKTQKLEVKIDSQTSATPEPLPDSNLNSCDTPAPPIASTPAPVRKKLVKPLKIGDRVVVVDGGGLYHGSKFTVAEIRPYSTQTGLLVNFDKPVSFCQ